MNTPSRAVGIEWITYGLLLALLGWHLHRLEPAMVPHLQWVALVGGAGCVAGGLLACRRPLRWRGWALLQWSLAVGLGLQARQAWGWHLTHEGSFRPVPMLVSLLCLMALAMGGMLWRADRGGK